MKVTFMNQGFHVPFTQSYMSMTTNRGDNISFTGRPYPHHDDKKPADSQPIKPKEKVPTEGDILYRHIDMLGNILDIKA